MSSAEPFTIGQLLSRVTQQGGLPLGLVLHVGAGAAALEDHAHTRAAHLVLVEGDPDTAAGLREAASQRDAATEVVAQAVSTAAGPLRWRRYNLSRLNGPLDASPLRSVYPRLREIASLDRVAVAFGALLERVAASRPPESAHVLVIDLPGQEQDLLASVESAVLQRFDWIIVRGCGPSLGEDGKAVALTRTWLSQAHYRMVVSDDEAKVLWPWSIHRFDADASRREQVDRQLAAAHSRASELEVEVRTLKAEVEALTKERAQLAGERDALAKDKAGLAVARDEQRALASERQTRIDELVKERAQLAGERDALAKDKANVVASRDEQSRALRDAKQRIAQLEEELVDTGARFGLLQEELVKAEAQIELISDLLLRDPHR